MRGDAGGWDKRYALSRARLSVTLRYRDLLRATIEPDFAGAACARSGSLCEEADLSDVFLDFRPFEGFDLRAGQAKTPYGLFETVSAWRLPSVRRGLVSEIVTDRLGFGGRRFGARARARARGLPTKPSLELGTYVDLGGQSDEDVASRIGVRPFKGAALELAGYLRAHASSDGDHGAASTLGFAYDRKRSFVLVDVTLGRARLLRIDGVETGRDSTFVAGRLLFARAFPLGGKGEQALPGAWQWRDAEVEPYIAIDGLDPNIRDTDDRGGSFRAGVNLYYLRAFRISGELERRVGQVGFVSPRETLLSLLLGVSLG